MFDQDVPPARRLLWPTENLDDDGLKLAADRKSLPRQQRAVVQEFEETFEA
jgi:hypothetical protein